MMNQRHRPSVQCTRRSFVQSAAALASAVALPRIVPASVFGATAPSNRITVGQIGCGHQAQRIVPSFLVHDDVQIVAVCDVNRAGRGYYYPERVLGRETAKRWIDEYYAEKASGGDPKVTVYERILAPKTAEPGAVAPNPPQVAASRGKGCDAYKDFRELLARTDIDAVTIVVPDHWHALIAIAAMRAGKDVYCEKPMSLTVHQGREMVKAVRRYNRVFQTGAQFRSCPGVRRACELVRNGRIGQVRRVWTTTAPNSFPSPGPGWQPQPVPEGFDYDFWLGPAPEAPYHIERCFHRWRYILDYSNGQTANFGAHTNDMAQWALGMDGTTPVEFEDNGSEFLPKGSLFDTAVKTAFRARYANGIELTCDTNNASYAKFEGTEGRLEISLGGVPKTFPTNIKDSVIGPNEIHLPRSHPTRETNRRNDIDADHVRNFLDAVKSRKGPIDPVEVGHSTASLCILGNIAQLLKRKFAWDPAAERSADEDVNRMLQRPMRAPWKLS